MIVIGYHAIASWLKVLFRMIGWIMSRLCLDHIRLYFLWITYGEPYMQSGLFDQINHIAMAHASNIDTIYCNDTIADFELTAPISWTAWYQFAYKCKKKFQMKKVRYAYTTLSVETSIELIMAHTNCGSIILI